MKENNIKTIALILTLVTFAIIVALIFRCVIIYGGPSSDTVCKNEYGAEWAAQGTRDFGITCIKIDYITLEPIDRKPIDYWGLIENKNYCDRPGFFEFGDWNPKCIKYDAYEVLSE